MTNFFEFREKLNRKRSNSIAEPAAMSDATASRSISALSVSQFTQLIDGAIKSGVPASLVVRGELSNVKRYGGSGHLYFTLKDPDACVDCVMWKSDAERLKFEPADGEEVLITGSVGVFAPRGRYQLYARKIEPFGKGALEAAFRQLCAKLQAEGLFAPERKRTLPEFPSHITIVTSRHTAALQDILKVLSRFKFLKVSIFHVPVQGAGAAEQIAAAIEAIGREIPVNRRGMEEDSTDISGQFEVILLARGGGSGEDLWAFNEEVVARAIARSAIPVVTGIGHEIDTSIADLVADYHAHTPTEAAQVVTAAWRGVAESLALRQVRLWRAARSMFNGAQHRLAMCERHEVFRRPRERLERIGQRLDDYAKRSQIAIARRINLARKRIEAGAAGVEKLAAPMLVARYHARLNELDRRLEHATSMLARRELDRLTRFESRLNARSPAHAIAIARQRSDQATGRLTLALRSTIDRSAARVNAMEAQLHALSPLAVLERGFSITTLKRGGAIVRSTADVQPGDAILTRLRDGTIESTVGDAKQGKLFE